MAGSLLDTGRHGRSRGRYRPMSEINVTPFVDVMLVLLIVFMIASPLMVNGVDLNLPEGASQAVETETQEPLTVSVTAEGQIFVGEDPVAKEELTGRLESITQGNKDRVLNVRGDRLVPYEAVAQVLSLVSEAGFEKVTMQMKKAK